MQMRRDQSTKSLLCLKAEVEDHGVPELGRRRRVVDMMLTAHSILRDRYAWRAASVDVAGLAFSVVLCLLTFVDPALLRYLGASDDRARLILGLCAGVVFFVSLVQLRVDWKARSERHGKAVERLARVKALYRRVKHELESVGGGRQADLVRALQEGDALLEDIIPIPDREFVRLKALHNRKVLVSRALDRLPAASLTLLRWVIWWRHTRATARSSATNQARTFEN